MPFYIVPGNHDFQWNVKGPADFIRVFGDDKFIFTHKNFIFAGITSAPLQKSSNGLIQQADISWLKNELKTIGETKPTIIITHYPLLDGDVDNWSDLINVLHKFNVKVILNGHYHRNVMLNFDGIPGIVNRSTLRAKDAIGGYSLYTVSDSIIVSEKRIGQPEEVWLEFPLELK
jgi:predicted phosphohydrolase